MHMFKKLLSIILVILALVSSAVCVTAYTTDDVANAALDMIFNHEGVYTTVVVNDNGAVSLGKVGWHGFRALQLLRTIVNADKEAAKKLLGDALYNEILTATNAQWDYRILTLSEKELVMKLLATEESKKAQDALAFEDIKKYIVHGQSLGITDGQALVYFADIENQMGSYGAERVGKAAIALAGKAADVSIDDMYNAAMADRTASSSPTRRKSAYNYCLKLKFGEGGIENGYKTGRYKIIADPSLRVRSGPGTDYATVTDPVPKGTFVNVTEVSGMWGKITVNGKTGWISLVYAEYSEVVVKPSVTPDINGNGKVDASDARLALRAAASIEKLSDAQKKLADCDSDGRVSAADARVILRIAAKLQ